MNCPLPTDFAPAERDEIDKVLAIADELLANPLIDIFNSTPIPLIIINTKRQTIFCNTVFQTASIFNTAREILGMRPGEALGCIHAHVHTGGCGTSTFCRDCGAASAILKSLRGDNSTEECRIMRSNNFEEEALDLQVFTSPFKYKEHDFILFTALDISHEKRKQNLEHLFFHDILNLVTGLKYTAQVICKTATSDKVANKCRNMNRTITQIAEEIQAQKALSSAEEGSLKVFPQITSTETIITNIREIYTCHNLCFGKKITISDKSINIDFETDSVILSRILGNMIKNALEASEEGATITIGSGIENGFIKIWVHNDSVMPEATKRQIFKRSFSTKGQGRGLGTYSMKLFTENYLKGQMSFQSNNIIGTIFSVALPEGGIR